MSAIHLHETLAEIEYLRERSAPQHGDNNYLILSDLLLALSALIDFQPRVVLDYGCGGMPYRSFFTGEYIGADSAENPLADLHLKDDGTLDSKDQSFDCILSTQVLEHVGSPSAYLEECRRLLIPNGTLIISTHGIFEDHPCPRDLWRWTADGLSVQLENAGFNVYKSFTITNGPRAALYLLERELASLSSLRKSPTIFALVFQIINRVSRVRLHNFADKKFSEYRFLERGVRHSSRYVGIAIKAYKT